MSDKECKQCKQKLNKTQKGMLIASIYIFITSIYGTYKLYELVKTLF